MVEKKVLWVAVIILLVLSTSALVVSVVPPPFLLHPEGPTRVSLLHIGTTGEATWFPGEVYDGSFSARLYSGATASDGGLVMIGPLNFPLSDLTDDRITFWVYHLDEKSPVTIHPYVNIVLDNDRVIEGVTSTSVDGSTVLCESGSGCLGYTAAEIWKQMKPSGGWYTSVDTSVDTVLAPVSSCTLSTPCDLSKWITAFPTSKVIQIQIDFGFFGESGFKQTVYIDDVTISPGDLTIIVLIEPETISSSDR